MKKNRPAPLKLVNAARRKLYGAAFREEKNAVSIRDLFRYSSRSQKIIVFLGMCVAVLNGLPMPAILLVYGRTVDQFVTTYFCDVIDQYNISEFCPADVDESNINQLYYMCNWTQTNISLPNLGASVSGNSLMFVIIAILVWITTWLQTTLLASACERIVCNVRITLFRSILSKPVSWFDCHDSGSINNYFSQTINKYKQGVGDKLGMLAQTASTLVLALIICLSYNWKLSLVLFALSPLFIVSSAYATTNTASNTVSEQACYAQAGSIAQQSFANIRTVHAFNGLDVVQKKYESHLGDAKQKGIRKGMMNALVLSSLWVVLYTSTTLGFWFGGRLIDEGITVGTVLIVFYTMQTAVFNLGTNLPHYNAMVEARSAAHALYETLGSGRKSLDGAQELKGSKLLRTVGAEESFGLTNRPAYTLGAVKFDNVSFSYPSRPDVKVLDGVNLEIPKGTTAALIGESGSGKSTIAQLLLGFYSANSGNIMIGDHSIDSIDVAHLRSQMGYVSQEPVLFSTTIAENIRLGKPDATDEELRAACKAANALEFIEEFPLKFETEVGEAGSQLSGGQKQRIAIARALISDPPYLILDEATSALDSQSEKYVQEALDAASRGRTTIIIAHRLSTIRNANIIIGMARGRVVEVGTHDELMATESMYRRLVHAQIKHDFGVVEDQEDEYNDIYLLQPRGPRRRHLTSTSSAMSQQAEIEAESPSALNTLKVMRYLLRTNCPEAPFIIFGCLACIAFGAMQVVYELFFAKMLTSFSHCDEIRRRQLIDRQSLDFLWIGAVTGLAIGVSTCCFAFSGEKLTKRIRERVFEALIRQETGFFDRPENSPGRLSTILSSEAAAVQGATGIRIGTTLSSFSILIVGLTVSFAFGWQLSLVILAFVPVLIAGGAISMQVTAGFDAGDKKYLEAAGRLIVESTSNIRLVKQLRQEKYFTEKYEENVNFVCKRNLRRSVITGFLFGFSFSCGSFIIALAYYAAAKFIEKGLMTSEDLMIVLGTLFFGAMAVGQSQAMAPDFGNAFDASRRVYSIIHRRPRIDARSEAGMKPDKFDGQFFFEGVSFAYPTRRARRVLKNISLKIAPNESIALVGMSGCGKSTIIHLLQRFYDPSRGRITLDGVDIRHLNLAWYRQHLGMVTQEPVLFDWSIAENIAFGDTSRHVTIEEIRQAAMAANIDSFISQLPEGYLTPVGTRGSLISGGQKQRICIARALVRNPALLLLDEATSALDPEGEKAVQEAINEAQKNRTSVSVAHRLATVQDCDKIFVLDGGRILEEGKHGDLLRSNGLYADLYQLSMH